MKAFKAFAATDRGIIRRSNEDRIFCQSGVDRARLLAAVADGMGGLDEGAKASSLAVGALLDHWSVEPDAAAPDLLRRAFTNAHGTIWRFANDRPSPLRM